MPSMIDASGLYGKQSSTTCMGLTLGLHNTNSQKGDALGTPRVLAMHWTAGSYTACYNAYHFNIAFDAKTPRACVVKNLALTQKGQHAWGRSTGALGISLCAMANANYPVHPMQLETAAQLAAEICFMLKTHPEAQVSLPRMASNARSIWAVGGFVKVPFLTDHAEIAKLDGYYPHRWDIGSQEKGARNLMEPLRKRAAVIYTELLSGTRKPMFDSLLK